MRHALNRREFLATSAAAGLGMMAGFGRAGRAAERAQPAAFKTKLHKAMIVRRPTEANLQSLKEAGFEGVEAGVASVEDAAKCRQIAEKLGMRIHSVLRGWVNFNNPKSVARDIASVEAALKAAQAYGADAVLLVPCRTGRVPMPNAWEFDIAFDPKTGHITRVARGDNAKYAKYIEIHNHATDTSREAIKKLIPAAEKAKVVIALENVWSNLWVQPAITENFIASFQSPWVKAYYDVGNNVKYSVVVREGKVENLYPPEVWIRTLKSLVAKVHIKDYKLKPDGKGGNWAKIREGSVNWPAVRGALEEVGYNGWLTNESGGLSVQELSKRFDLIIAGK